MRKIKQAILNEIKPSKEHVMEVNNIVKTITSKIKIKNAKAFLGGSGAKGTWLKDAYDIDIYVAFNNTKKDISQILKKELKKKFSKVETLHGSRDYYRLRIKDYSIEIIPIIKISRASQALNITDVSQLHVSWVKKNSNENLRDEIRLTKQFCKAQKVYGAESYIKGFSGYVLEILTIKYSGFNNLAKKASKWKNNKIIGDKKLIKKLNKSKKESPLILIDPVQKERNASAALSQERYDLFRKACKKFINNPTKSYFKEKEFDLVKIKKKALVLKIIPLKKKVDVAGAKMVKCIDYLKNNLERYGFKVKDYNFHWNKEAYFYFVFSKDKLDKKYKHYGPPLKNKKSLESFKKKYKRIKKDKRKAYVILNRDFTNAKDYLNYLIKKDKHIRELVKKINLVL